MNHPGQGSDCSVVLFVRRLALSLHRRQDLCLDIGFTGAGRNFSRVFAYLDAGGPVSVSGMSSLNRRVLRPRLVPILAR